MAKNREIFNEINITPLTDIFLVLLIIMMVIAPLLDQQGLKLIVPDNVEQEKIKKEQKFVNVFVSSDDKIMIDDVEVQPEELENIIKEKSKTQTDGVLIQTEDDASHGAVVKVIDSARKVGVVNVSLSD